jgi:uncharacterized phage protein (TIGR01671 family)
VREIKFRGKRVNDGEMIYGDLIHLEGKPHIYQHKDPVYGGSGSWLVVPETVGQFTGLHDKNGVEIYEGDVVCAQYTKNMESEIAKEMGGYDDFLHLTDEQIYKLFPKHFTTDIVMWDKSDAIFGYTPLKGFGKYSRVESQMGETKRAFIIGNIYDNSDLIRK